MATGPATSVDRLAYGRGMAGQIMAVIAPPAFWAIRIAASYVLVPYACWQERAFMLHLVSWVLIGATAAIAWYAWRIWRRAGAMESTEFDGVLARTRFMALFGLFSALFFAAVMVAEELASIYIDPCLTSGRPL